MSTYEQLVINGIPFLHSNSKLYYYELTPSEPVEIGALVSGTLQLHAGWIERIQPRVDAWRLSLSASERGKTVRAPKPSKPKRSPKSTAAAAGGAGEATGATGAATATADTTTDSASAPVTNPKRVLRRRVPLQASSAGVP